PTIKQKTKSGEPGQHHGPRRRQGGEGSSDDLTLVVDRRGPEVMHNALVQQKAQNEVAAVVIEEPVDKAIANSSIITNDLARVIDTSEVFDEPAIRRGNACVAAGTVKEALPHATGADVSTDDLARGVDAPCCAFGTARRGNCCVVAAAVKEPLRA